MNNQITRTRNLLIGVILACLAPVIISAQEEATPTITTVQIADHVYMLSGWGGNIGILTGDDGILMVDHQNASYSPQIQEAVGAISPDKVKYLLNTHYHRDHTGGNELMRQAGAAIIAHENVYKRLSSGWVITYFELENPPLEASWLPEVTFSDNLSLHFNDEEIELSYVGNAHTDDNVIVYFRNANVLQVGDIFFHKMYPFIDLDNGGSFEGLIKAVDMALATANDSTKVIPGHGPATDYAGLKTYRDMMALIIDRVKSLIADGKSLEEIIAAKPTAEYDKANPGFVPPEDLVKHIYQDLTR